MDVVQFFESSVGDRESGRVVRFLAIPRRSILNLVHNPAESMEALTSALELGPLQPVRSPALAQAIVAMFRADEGLAQLQAQAVLAQFWQGSDTPEPLLEFAEHVAYTDLVPFEESLIRLVSLASKAATLAAKPASLGAFIGVVVGGTSPLLIVTVPAGIILCATAAAFAKFVDAKRDQIFSKLLGLPAKAKTDHSANASAAANAPGASPASPPATPPPPQAGSA